jgi:hypothetical protein
MSKSKVLLYLFVMAFTMTVLPVKKRQPRIRVDDIFVEENAMRRHAEKQGHTEADLIRSTCRKNPERIQIFRERKPNENTFHLLCQMDNGLWGDWIVIVDHEGKKFEKTAFIPQDGSWKEVDHWLTRKGASPFYQEW